MRVLAVTLLIFTSALVRADPEAEAASLIDRWLATQNESRFDAYSALYAAELRGTRRSGDRVRVFDRAGWLTDRARMFKRPMRVRIDDVQTRTVPEGVVVRFKQDWSSGSYHDVGTKELVLGRRGGALAIVREEMLESIVGDHPSDGVLALDDEQRDVLRLLYPDVEHRRHVRAVMIGAGCDDSRAALVLSSANEGEVAVLDKGRVVARGDVRAPPGNTLAFFDEVPVGLRLSDTECALRLSTSDESFVRLTLYRVAAPTIAAVLERTIPLENGLRMTAADSVQVACSARAKASEPCELYGETSTFYCCDCEGNGTSERTTYRWKKTRYVVAHTWHRTEP